MLFRSGREEGIAWWEPCAITRVRSRGCSQIDTWLYHPLLHESPIIFARVSQAPSGVTNPRAAMDHPSHEASTRLQRRHTARAWSDFIFGLLVTSAQIGNSWRDLTLPLLANANHAQTWRNVVHHVVHRRPPWMFDWLATLPLRLVMRMKARSGLEPSDDVETSTMSSSLPRMPAAAELSLLLQHSQQQ